MCSSGRFRSGRVEASLDDADAKFSCYSDFMSKILDPLVSEFATEQAAEDYDRWFRAKVQEALESTKSRLTHDEAVLKVRALLERKRKQGAGGTLG